MFSTKKLKKRGPTHWSNVKKLFSLPFFFSFPPESHLSLPLPFVFLFVFPFLFYFLKFLIFLNICSLSCIDWWTGFKTTCSLTVVDGFPGWLLIGGFGGAMCLWCCCWSVAVTDEDLSLLLSLQMGLLVRWVCFGNLGL